MEEISASNKKIKKNITLADTFKPDALKDKWVKHNTAFLVFHGVGNQLPLETLDMFGRGFIDAFSGYGGHTPEKFTLTHHLAKKEGTEGVVWFDNFIRLELEGEKKHIDIYEYYWAHYAEEGKATLEKMQEWVEKVAEGAKNFYQNQEKLGEAVRDNSLFFKDGKFRHYRYKSFVWVSTKLTPIVTNLSGMLLNGLKAIPVIGWFVSFLSKTRFVEWCAKKVGTESFRLITSVAGDVVIYNTTDPKYDFYKARSKILNGAVKAIRYLIEPQRQYERLLIAGHSLGTEIAFDALNRVNHLISQGEVVGVNREGYIEEKGVNIDEYISGFVTFGSPLDKVAFFFREQTEDDAYLRRWLLNNFHCFKQKDWDECGEKRSFNYKSSLKRFLDDIPWRNYHDGNDLVSGHLDFYKNVSNIDCAFVKGRCCTIKGLYPFTHSYYWTKKEMYGDIIQHLL